MKLGNIFSSNKEEVVIKKQLLDSLNIDFVGAWSDEYKRLGNVYASWGAILVVFFFPMAALPELLGHKDNELLWYLFRFAPSFFVAITYLLYRKYQFSHEVVFEVLALFIFASGAYRADCSDWISQMINNVTLFITAAFLTVLRPFYFIINYVVILIMNIAFYVLFCGFTFASFWLEPSTPIFIVSGIAGFSIAIFRYYNLKRNFHQKLALYGAVEELRNTNKAINTAKNELLIKNNQILEQNEELTQQKEEILSQRDVLEQQKDKIEASSIDIMASITYAQRIQAALLPSDEQMSQAFAEYFVLYRPRNVVSGDFYWMSKKGDYSFLAVIDCTGHGVPGALMSMLANSALNNTVLHNDVVDPAAILLLIEQELAGTLNSKRTGTFDGFDISLCVIDYKKELINFSGGNQSLLICKGDEMQLIKGERYGIGGILNVEKKFTSHQFSLTGDTSFYLFTDGYADQFGGKRESKYLRKRLVEFIANLQGLPLSDQKKALEIELKRWMTTGNQEQVDDILVLGFKA